MNTAAAHSAQIRADLLLLLTALIWGFAFVAQRAGMEHVGPFFFNGVRFALGCLPLLPFVLRTTATPLSSRLRHALRGGLLAGLFLFTRRFPATSRHRLHDSRQGRVHHRAIRNPSANHRSLTAASQSPQHLDRRSGGDQRPVPAERGAAPGHCPRRRPRTRERVLLGRARAGHRQTLASARLGDAGFFTILRLLAPQHSRRRRHRAYRPATARRCGRTRVLRRRACRWAWPIPCR